MNRKLIVISLFTTTILYGCNSADTIDIPQIEYTQPEVTMMSSNVSKNEVHWGKKNTAKAESRKQLPLFDSKNPLNKLAKNYTPLQKPDFKFSMYLYPQYTSKFSSLVKDFMAQHVTKADISDFKIGGWTAPDEAEMWIEFYGVKDINILKKQILPDLETVLNKNGLG